jgi:hypothetical protein
MGEQGLGNSGASAFWALTENLTMHWRGRNDIYQTLGGKEGRWCEVKIPNSLYLYRHICSQNLQNFVSSIYPDCTITLHETFVIHDTAALPHEKGPKV